MTLFKLFNRHQGSLVFVLKSALKKRLRLFEKKIGNITEPNRILRLVETRSTRPVGIVH